MHWCGSLGLRVEKVYTVEIADHKVIHLLSLYFRSMLITWRRKSLSVAIHSRLHSPVPKFVLHLNLDGASNEHATHCMHQFIFLALCVYLVLLPLLVHLTC